MSKKSLKMSGLPEEFDIPNSNIANKDLKRIIVTLARILLEETDESKLPLLEHIHTLLTFKSSTSKPTSITPKETCSTIPNHKDNVCSNKYIKNGEKKMKRNEILHEAEKCVCTDRESTYGSPEDSFNTISKLWKDYLTAKGHKVNISSKDVAVMMILLKVARIAGKADKLDNWIDIAGYSACGGEIEGK